MRAARCILIVGGDDTQVGILSFVLRNTRHTRHTALDLVVTASSAAETKQILEESSFDIMIVMEPLDDIQAALDSARNLPRPIITLLIVKSLTSFNTYFADSTLILPTMAAVRNQITFLLSRRRVLRDGMKRRPVMREDAVTVEVKTA